MEKSTINKITTGVFLAAAIGLAGVGVLHVKERYFPEKVVLTTDQDKVFKLHTQDVTGDGIDDISVILADGTIPYIFRGMGNGKYETASHTTYQGRDLYITKTTVYHANGTTEPNRAR